MGNEMAVSAKYSHFVVQSVKPAQKRNLVTESSACCFGEHRNHSKPSTNIGSGSTEMFPPRTGQLTATSVFGLSRFE